MTSIRFTLVAVSIAISSFAAATFGFSSLPGKDSVIVNKDVATITVTSRSRYIIDSKRNLCFYETFTNYLATALPIPCTSFYE